MQRSGAAVQTNGIRGGSGRKANRKGADQVSAARWLEKKRGMYIKTPTRGARAGKTCYWARVWIKSRQDFAHFYLGLKPKAAQEGLDQILGNPEAALPEREQQQKEAA